MSPSAYLDTNGSLALQITLMIGLMFNATGIEVRHYEVDGHRLAASERTFSS